MVGAAETLILPSQITVNNIEETRDMMAGWLNDAENQLRCLGSGVETIDATGLQLMIAFNKEAARKNREFVIVSPSPVLRDVLVYSGVDKILAMGR